MYITEDNIIKDTRNCFRLEKESNAIKSKIIRDIETLFESEEEDYFEPVRIGNALSNNYIEYEREGDKNKRLSIKKYVKKIKPYLSKMINVLKASGEWKIQLSIAMNFMSSKDTNYAFKEW